MMNATPSRIGRAILAVGLLAALNGHAQDRSYHKNMVVKPIKEGGKIVGAKIDLVLHDVQGIGQAHVALVPPELRAQSAVADAKNSIEHHRPTFVDREKVHLFDPVATMKSTPQEASFEIRYGQGNRLQGGERLDVVSSWTRPGNDKIVHTWGAVYGADRPSEHLGDIQLPAEPKP
jgi:hypothetical protein